MNSDIATMNWQKAVQDAIRSPPELADVLELDWELFSQNFDVSPRFSLEVPRSFVGRMKKGDLNDPLLRQVLFPHRDRRYTTYSVFSLDPLKEHDTLLNPLPALLHKYTGRVLVISTGRCAIHCQYCFRQNFPYKAQGLGNEEWASILSYLNQHQEIHEVVFSGGDPWMRTDKNWARLLQDLENIPHLKTVRFHTRLPVVIPERLTEDLLGVLQSTRLNPVVVLHSNHPQEWDSTLIDTVSRFTSKGVLFLNQGVLLRGINDEVPILTDLCHAIWSAGVLPYYMHRLDPVVGAECFEIPISRLLALEQGLREVLPGYLVPRFVQEVPGALSKQPLR